MDTESLVTITYWWYTLSLMLLKKLKVCFRKESPFLPHHYFKIKAILINLPNEKDMWQQQNHIRTFKLYFLSWAICLSDPCRKYDWSFQETPAIPTFYRTHELGLLQMYVRNASLGFWVNIRVGLAVKIEENVYTSVT